jgi:ligand-binding sensor domain-containing protein
MYLGVWGGGLLEWQYDKERWQRYQDPDKEMEIDLFLDDGIVHDIVTGVTVDALARVWTGTYFGLSSYDGRKWVSALDHDTPLLSNFINFVKAEGEYCWIGTDQGLCAWDRENWWTYRTDPESGEPTAVWYPAEGEPEILPLDSIFPHDYILGLSFHEGEIWVATEGGLARGRISSDRAAADPAPEEGHEPGTDDGQIARKLR